MVTPKENYTVTISPHCRGAEVRRIGALLSVLTSFSLTVGAELTKREQVSAAFSVPQSDCILQLALSYEIVFKWHI